MTSERGKHHLHRNSTTRPTRQGGKALIKKMMVVTTLVGAIALGTGLPAFAATTQTTFAGPSHEGFPVRYAAVGQDDGTGTGTFFYQPEVGGSTLTIQCEGFTKYIATHTNNPKPDGYPKSIANSNQCFGADTRYYAHIESIDRIGIGRDGRTAELKDSICITIKLYPARDNPDPVIKDCGAPKGGDVVIRDV
jgi:hypothetical protein